MRGERRCGQDVVQVVAGPDDGDRDAVGGKAQQ
jgi:hypothetical protein